MHIDVRACFGFTLFAVAAPGYQTKETEKTEEVNMIALVVLILILALFGGLGFAAHFLWYVLLIAVALWLIGFFVGGVDTGGRRRWYGRW